MMGEPSSPTKLMLTELAQGVQRSLDDHGLSNVAFSLLVWPDHAEAKVAYVSNLVEGRRGETAVAMKQVLNRWKGDEKP